MFDENSNNVMAMVNHLMNIKDSRWLQVEVCREFQRGQCSRTDQECKFAHPPPHVDIQNGKVTACYDSIKGRCTRDNPKCKYLHPPQHLKDQLLINGRNNLALKNLLVSQLTNPSLAPTMMNPAAANVGLTQMPTAAMIPGVSAYYPLNATPMYQGLYPVAASPDGLQSPMGMLSAGTAASPASLVAAQAQQKARTDRVEVCREFLRGSCQRPEAECKFAHPPPDVERGTDGSVTVCMDFVRGAGRDNACQRHPCRYFHPTTHLLAMVRARLGNIDENNGVPQQQQQGTAVPMMLNGNGCHHGGSIQQQMATIPATSPNAASAAASLALAAAQQRIQQQQQQQLLIQQQNQVQSQAQAQITAQQQAAAAVVSQHQSVVTTTSERAKKRPLEPDYQSVNGQQASLASAVAAGDTSSLLLAAAAFQQQQQQQQQQVAQTVPTKRPAMEKSGMPVYQPAFAHNQMSIAALQQYPMAQLAFPGAAGFQTSYIPAVTFPVSGGGGLAAYPELNINPANQAQTALMSSQHHLAALPGTRIPGNVASVAYFDEAGQLLDTLPVCRDFKQGHCERPNCRYVHLLEDFVEVHDGKVTVCRDFAKGKCSRVMCKYYHVPVLPGSSMLLSRMMQPATPAVSAIFQPTPADQATALLFAQQQYPTVSSTACSVQTV